MNDAFLRAAISEAGEQAQREAEREGLVYDDSGLPPAPHGKMGTADDDNWMPPLTPTGMDLFFCEAKFMLAHGERGGGKTIAVLHKLVKHAYDNDGASVCISTLIRSAATLGGAWTKLQSIVLPAWQEGWTDNEEIWHDGLGLEGEGPGGEIVFKMDDSRNRFFWIKNVHGGWSQFFLRSMQHGEQIQARIKGVEFTAFFFDELTETETEDYFIHPIQQLGRINGVEKQFYIGACNPPDDGEEHWVHKLFFRGFDNPSDKIPKKRTDYAEFHFPMTENEFMTPQQKADYIANVMEACRNDPTAHDRLILGKWTKKPTGKGLFRDYFLRSIHVKGDWAKRSIIIPKGDTIEIGYDVGTANSSMTFLQRVPLRTGEGWSVFDEIVLVERYVPIPQLCLILLKHMNYWCVSTGIGFHFNHISDSAAFDQMRPDGSYDARKIEECVRDELTRNHALYPGLAHLIHWENDRKTGEKLKVTAINFELVSCPKPAGSKSQRVKMLITRLQNEQFVVSDKCRRIIGMLENIESDEREGIFYAKRSIHIHPLDSTTYPIYHHEMGGKTRGTIHVGRTSNLVDL